MNDLFPPPAHYALVDRLADAALAEGAVLFAKLRSDLDSRFRQILAFHNRSIAQKRRFRRLRALLEKTA